MGRGRSSRTAAQTQLAERRTFSGHWDEISRNLKQRHRPAGGVQSVSEELLSDLVLKLRTNGFANPHADRLTAVLTANLRQELPGLDDLRRVIPMREATGFWEDVAASVHSGLPAQFQARRGVATPETHAEVVGAIKDMSRVAFMSRATLDAPLLMHQAAGTQLSARIVQQLPVLDQSAIGDLAVLTSRCVQLGYHHGLAEPFDYLGLNHWKNFYGKLLESWEWMRPTPHQPFMDRYRKQFLAVLSGELNDGTIKPNTQSLRMWKRRTKP